MCSSTSHPTNEQIIVRFWFFLSYLIATVLKTCAVERLEGRNICHTMVQRKETLWKATLALSSYSNSCQTQKVAKYHTLPIPEILSNKNAPAWFSMVLYLKKNK